MDETTIYHRAFRPSLVMESETRETTRQAKRPKFIPGMSASVKGTHGEDFRRKPPKGLCRCKHCHHLTSNRGAECWWCLTDQPRPHSASQRLSRIARQK